MQNEACQDDTQLQEVDGENPETVFSESVSGSQSHIPGSTTRSKSRSGSTDGAYTKQVMDDLDALLADLQTTTAHISSYQSSNQSQAGQPPAATPSTPTQARQNHQQQLFQPQRQFSHPQQQQQQQSNEGYYNSNGSNGYSDSRQPRYSNGLEDPHPYQQQQQYPPHGYQRQHSAAEYPRHPATDNFETQGQGQRYHQQAGYQGQSRHPQGVVTVKRVSYASSDDGGHSGSSTPPPLPPPPPSEVLDSLAFARGVGAGTEPDGPVYEQQSFPPGGGGGGVVVQRQGSIKGRGERMSALSNNLSELDQLLQDLNSAQFMAEVDRKSSNIIKVLNYLEDQSEAGAGHVNEATTVVNGGPSSRAQTTPAVAPKPVGVNLRNGSQQVAPPPQRTSVDNLLDELEGAAPQPGRFPEEPFDPHYQELSAVRTPQHRPLPPVQQQQHSQPQPQSHHLQPGGSHYLPASSSSTSSSSSYHHPQTASTATRELDELMNSLSEFKLQNTDEIDPDPTYAKPMKSRTASGASPTTPQGQGNFPPQQQQTQINNQQPPQVPEDRQLENMLGDLQSDMNRQGVNTKQKGVCAACQKSIVGQVIAALGKTWHVEHFVCAHCEEPLGTRNFYERDCQAYCETDYHHLFAPRCAYCNGPIVDKCIEALSKMWHPEHFFCAQCGRPFGEEDFHEKDGQAYCREHYFQMFAPKCGGCGLPIMENYISALNRQWHPECFVCWECRAPFGTGSFFDYEGLPYCETHYHAKKGSLCASCEKPITGRCITAMFKKFHPEHFVCAFCLKQLNKGTFKEQNDKPYCHPCFVKLFG